ncbi:MAG: hypothetical protein PHT94_00955 [Candidatus Nanoarchaeia archaeon]|nr:hypothetical protein [Candidatus Nanoarchaeia archaeon]
MDYRNIVPNVDNLQTLGTIQKKWKDIYVSKINGVNVEELNTGGGKGGLSWEYITISTDAESNTGYLMHGDITLTLPLNPEIGDQIGWKNLSGTQTIDRNGKKIESSEEDIVLDIPNSGGLFVYQGIEYGWVNVTEINTLVNTNVITQDDISDVVRTGDITDVVRTGDITDVVRTGDINDFVKEETILTINFIESY